MAATGTPTTNIGLRRPQGTDPASVDDINYNSEIIDTKLGAVGSTSVQEQINTLNSKMMKDKVIVRSAATTHNFSFPNQSSNIIVIDGQDGSRQYMALVYNSTNSLSIFELAKGNNVTIAYSGPTIGVTFNQSIGCTARIINISGSSVAE